MVHSLHPSAHGRRPRLVRIEQPLWLIIPLAVTMIVLAVLIVLLTEPRHLLGAVLAYVNLIIIGTAAVYFVRQRTLQGLIPVLFLAWFAMGWPLPTIYFATMFPSEAYHPFADEREILYGAVWVQTVVLVFLVTYLTTLRLFQGRYQPWIHSPENQETDRRAGSVVLWMVMAAITLHAVSQVIPPPGPLGYVANGSYNYLHGLMLMVGVLFLRLNVETRLRALLFMALAAAFYLIGNARGLAVLPATLFAIGLIFVSDISQRYKTWAIILACAGLPLALVIGNTTRVLLGSIGFQDIGTRLNALGEWQEVLRRTPVLVSTFHRLFFVGGHSIIAYTPEYFPYLEFSWTHYGWEFVTRLLPGKLFYAPFYSDNERLRAYGFLITEATSYPLSLLGSLYMLGGVVPVAMGAVAFGLFHTLLGRLIAIASRRTSYLGLFIFSMIASTLIWSQNVDLITNVRVTMWRILSGFVLYLAILRPLVRRAAPRRSAIRRGGARAWRRTPAATPAAGSAALASGTGQRRIPTWTTQP
jgi:hypothetical protein